MLFLPHQTLLHKYNILHKHKLHHKMPHKGNLMFNHKFYLLHNKLQYMLLLYHTKIYNNLMMLIG